MKMLLSSSGIWQQVGYLIPVDLLMYMRYRWKCWWRAHITSCHPKRWETPRKEDRQSSFQAAVTHSTSPEQQEVSRILEIVSFWQPGSQNWVALRRHHRPQWGKAAWFFLRELYPGKKWRRGHKYKKHIINPIKPPTYYSKQCYKIKRVSINRSTQRQGEIWAQNPQRESEIFSFWANRLSLLKYFCLECRLSRSMVSSLYWKIFPKSLDSLFYFLDIYIKQLSS